MALVNQAKREINAKLVYFGPGLSGKPTSLKHVHGKLKPEFRGAMKAMGVQEARMLFFDFTPPGDGNVHGFKVRFHVYTVSGEKVDPAAWKMVLKGVDGIVFVADAHPGSRDANRASMEQLQGFLSGYGQSLASVPVVLQYNKCDLPEATAVGELEGVLNPGRLASFKASSQTGDGVLQALLTVVKTVLNQLRDQHPEGVSAEGESPAAEAAPAAPAAGEPAAPAPAAPAATAPPAPEEPLSLEIAGPPQVDASGVMRLPLTIRSGARSKSVHLNISLSLGE